eukprot:6321173-Pyramimonas_sp.AAC.1
MKAGWDTSTGGSSMPSLIQRAPSIGARGPGADHRRGGGTGALGARAAQAERTRSRNPRVFSLAWSPHSEQRQRPGACNTK